MIPEGSDGKAVEKKRKKNVQFPAGPGRKQKGLIAF